MKTLKNIKNSILFGGVIAMIFTLFPVHNALATNSISSPQVSVSIIAGDNDIPYGEDTSIYWYPKYATSCVGANGSTGWAGSKYQYSGAFYTGTLYKTTTFDITCSNSFSTATDSVTVYVAPAPIPNGSNNVSGTNNTSPAPSVNFVSGNTNLQYGDSTYMSWSTSNASSCTGINGSNGWAGDKETSGTFYTESLTNDTTYTLTCTGVGGTTTKSVTINIDEPVVIVEPPVVINPQPTDICHNGECTPFATTTLASNIGYNSARLNGLSSANQRVDNYGYFEYGKTSALGQRTASKYIGSDLNNSFYASMVNVFEDNTTYYYRAVVENDYGTSRGEMRTFTTKDSSTLNTSNNTQIIYRDRIVVEQAPTVETTAVTVENNTSVSKESLVYLNIEENGQTVSANQLKNYTIYYKNISTKNLKDVILTVALPSDINLTNSSLGYLSDKDNTFVVNIGNLYPSQEGRILLETKVDSDVLTGKILVVTGNMAYTTVENDSQEEVFAYSKNEVINQNENLASATVLAGNGFLPNTLVGWLVLILVLVIIILLAKRVYKK